MSRPTANQSIIAFFVGLRAICVQNACEKDVRPHRENLRCLVFLVNDHTSVSQYLCGETSYKPTSGPQ